MEQKRVHFAECRAESELTHGVAGCPTLRPSIRERVECEGGQSGEYACDNVDLLSYVGMEELGSTETNDIWGWTDPELGNEIAIVSLLLCPALGLMLFLAWFPVVSPENSSPETILKRKP